MKHQEHPRRRPCPRCLDSLSAGLFFTACALFSFSFGFYFLSLLPF